MADLDLSDAGLEALARSMCGECGFPGNGSPCRQCSRILSALRRVRAAATVAERERVAEAIIAAGYATGHGDTAADMVREALAHARDAAFERAAQVSERYNGPVARSDGRRAVGPGELIADAIREAAKEGK